MANIPATPPEFITSAKRTLDAGDFESAIGLLMAGTSKFPANPLLRAHLGMAYLRAGQRESALQAFKEAQSRSQTPIDWVERGISAIEKGSVLLHDVQLNVPPEVVSDKVLRYLIEGGYEGKERSLLRNNVRSVDRVLELGAGLGYLACMIGREYPEVEYIAIEANPRLIPVIQQNFKANGCRAELMHGVASVGSGIVSFNMADDFWASSTSNTSQPCKAIALPAVDVNAVIDDFKPTMLVMDIEGGELELMPRLKLAGVSRVLLELHPEVYGHAGATKVIRGLIDEGYLLDAKQSGAQVFLFVR